MKFTKMGFMHVRKIIDEYELIYPRNTIHIKFHMSDRPYCMFTDNNYQAISICLQDMYKH